MGGVVPVSRGQSPGCLLGWAGLGYEKAQVPHTPHRANPPRSVPPCLRKEDLTTALSRLLGDTVRVFTTPCVNHEVKKLGPELADARTVCRSCALHHCGHDKGKSAAVADCMAEQIGEATGSQHPFAGSMLHALRWGGAGPVGGARVRAWQRCCRASRQGSCSP